jgi:hypothetical protein
MLDQGALACLAGADQQDNRRVVQGGGQLMRKVA